MAKTLLVLSVLFTCWISSTYSKIKEDDKNFKKFDNAITDQIQKYDQWKVHKRVLSSNDETMMNDGESQKRVKGQTASRYPSEHHHYIKHPEHKSYKDEDLIRAVESFLQAKRARGQRQQGHQRRAWISQDINYKGQNTTSTTAPVVPQTPPQTPPTTPPPQPWWCKLWSFLCRGKKRQLFL